MTALELLNRSLDDSIEWKTSLEEERSKLIRQLTFNQDQLNKCHNTIVDFQITIGKLTNGRND